MRGSTRCYAHRDDDGPDIINAAPGAGKRDRRSEAYARAARAGQHHKLVEEAVQQIIRQAGAERSLEHEIGALRFVLNRVIAMDALEGDPAATAATVARLVDSIVRAVKMQRALSGDLADDLAGSLTTVLIEMGLGDEA
jgi:hypothetical protein